MTSMELRKLSEVDIRKVNRSELVDIKDVQINTDLPFRERIMDYISQVKNPYCYISNGIMVKLSFAGTKSLTDCLESYLAFEGDSFAWTADTNRFVSYGRLASVKEAS